MNTFRKESWVKNRIFLHFILVGFVEYVFIFLITPPHKGIPRTQDFSHTLFYELILYLHSEQIFKMAT